MRIRHSAAAAFGVVLMSASLGHAATPKPATIDGVKVKSITWETPVAAQQHLTWTVDGVDTKSCTAECDVKPFVYKPAASAKGTLSVLIKWASDTTTDIDLYVIDADGKDIAHCGGGHGTGEIVSIPMEKLVSGQTYRVVSAYYNVTTAETLKGKIDFPSTYTPTSPVIDDPNFGCSQDGSSA
ncbi:MAG: hypothetical protein ABR520_06785 [Mycobacteriales bacterium]|nr:hypothetical protein [Frankia sp.]